MTKILLVSIISSLLSVNTLFASGSRWDGLQPGARIHGFCVTTVYTDGDDQTVGVRLIHERDDFTLDLFSIESSPQAFYWIKTISKWDKGEPHTCEHLLLGKGNVGRSVAALEEMTLGTSTAYTDQLVTCYHFNTIAGPDAFFRLFEEKLNALINPDFTDEEIRREVAHIGVVARPDGSLWVEEKGTVYTEMVSSYEKPWSYLWETLDETVFGSDQPAANVSGGRPDAIRQMTPADLREFHSEFYHLANMGAIVSIPSSIGVEDCLDRLSKSLSNCQNQADSSSSPGIRITGLPKPNPILPVGSILIRDYPSDNSEDSGEMAFSWPAQLEFGLEEETMLYLFLGALANGSSSLLYEYLFDSEKRQLNLGAGYVYGSSSRYPGRPIRISLGGLANSNITEARIREVRQLILNKISEVARYSAGSTELIRFNARVSAMLAQNRRYYQRVLDTPPQFGDRGGPAGQWLSVLEGLEMEQGDHKSLVLKDILDRIEARINSGENVWTSHISGWKLLESEPYAVAIKPSKNLLKSIGSAKETRLASYVKGFKERYSESDPQAALRRYKTEFDSTTTVLDALQAHTPYPKFVDNPPMTLDPDLQYQVSTIDNVSVIATTFENMKSVTIGLAFNLDPLPEELLVYVPILPALLSQIGVEKNGKVIEHDEMETLLRKEIQSFGAYFSNSEETGRATLILKSSGSNLTEAVRAVDWMQTALTHPLINKSNLVRIHDIAAESLVGVRNTMKGGEEGWVDYPFNAYRFQSNPRFLASDCFLTQAHYYQRLKWMLTDVEGGDTRSGVASYIKLLQKKGKNQSRTSLAVLLQDASRLPVDSAAHTITAELAGDLNIALSDIPDANLASDWDYLVATASHDLMAKPEEALNGMRKALELLTRRSNARCFIISNTTSLNSLEKPIELLLENLPSGSSEIVKLDSSPRIFNRLRERSQGVTPTFAGLINPDTRNGLLHFNAPLHAPYDTSRDAILDALTGKLFGGGGAHGFFMQTWGAGLAYSNGIGYRERMGVERYYAERCPDVSETMRFVVGILNRTPKDPSLTEYVTALCFADSRAADTYEARGEAMAMNLLDDRRPEQVAAFRSAVLTIRYEPGLIDTLWNRREKVYGSTLVGYGKPPVSGRKGAFFMIGPDEQFRAMESLISKSEKSQPVYRLYPRDFWLAN